MQMTFWYQLEVISIACKWRSELTRIRPEYYFSGMEVPGGCKQLRSKHHRAGKTRTDPNPQMADSQRRNEFKRASMDGLPEEFSR